MWVWESLPPGLNPSSIVSELNRKLRLLQDALARMTRGVTQVDALATNAAVPKLGRGSIVRTQNTSPTTITGLAGASPGQRVTIVFGDSNTTVQHGGNLYLTGSTNRTGAPNTSLTLVTLDGATWVEEGRS